jgi:hypothetical protein
MEPTPVQVLQSTCARMSRLIDIYKILTKEPCLSLLLVTILDDCEFPTQIGLSRKSRQLVENVMQTVRNNLDKP